MGREQFSRSWRLGEMEEGAEEGNILALTVMNFSTKNDRISSQSLTEKTVGEFKNRQDYLQCTKMILGLSLLEEMRSAKKDTGERTMELYSIKGFSKGMQRA